MVTKVGRPPSIPVHFTEDMVCPLERDDFLANKTNKQQFINLLSNHFEQNGNEILYAVADADVMMVKTTMSSDCPRWVWY